MPAFSRGSDNDRLAAGLNNSLKYEADRETARLLLDSLSHADWSSKQGLMNHKRAVAADALQDQDRHQESDLLRSTLPIYVSHGGEVRQRVAHPRVEKAFVKAYLEAALENSMHPTSHNPLSWSHGPEDMHPEVKRVLTSRAIAFLNDNHKNLNWSYHLTPERAARDFYSIHNVPGASFLEDSDLYGQDQAEALSDSADNYEPYHLKLSNKGKVVRDTETQYS